MVHQWPSSSLVCIPVTSPGLCAVTRISFKARLISLLIEALSMLAHNVLISVSVKVRLRLLVGARALTPVKGVWVRISRSTPKLNILRVTFNTWLLMAGVPRSMMLSNKRVTSRLVMPAALRLPQVGMISMLSNRSSASHDLLNIFACLSMYSVHRSATLISFAFSSASRTFSRLCSFGSCPLPISESIPSACFRAFSAVILSAVSIFART
ncbi:MAG: hypothetical protein ACD_16C00112G0001, partial [uncultured bacterium]